MDKSKFVSLSFAVLESNTATVVGPGGGGGMMGVLMPEPQPPRRMAELTRLRVKKRKSVSEERGALRSEASARLDPRERSEQ
jgi:hypothetical protein